MKIIDLLNKIANGEEVPKKFIIKGSCFKDLYFEYNEKYNCYDLIGEKFKNGCYVFGYSELNDEIEIIEEKKIPEETTVSEEQILFNNLTSIDQDYVIRIMKMLQQPTNYLKSKGE